MYRALLEYYVLKLLMWVDDRINHPIESLVCKVYPKYALGYDFCHKVMELDMRLADQLEMWESRSDFGWPTHEITYRGNKEVMDDDTGD